MLVDGFRRGGGGGGWVEGGVSGQGHLDLDLD